MAQHKKHHSKPVRKRHLSLLVLGILLLAVTGFALGLSRANSRSEPVTRPTVLRTQELARLESDAGFSLQVDLNVFTIEAIAGEDTYSGADITASRDYNEVNITPSSAYSESQSIGSRLQLTYGNLTSEFVQSLVASPNVPAEQLVAQLVAPQSTPNSRYTLVSSQPEELDGLTMQKSVYAVATTLGQDLPPTTTYFVQWSGVHNSQPFTLSLRGLVGDAGIPKAYENIIASVRFEKSIASLLGSQIQPLGLSLPFDKAAAAEELDDKYLSDLVSPAVVKVYSGVCGKLAVNGVVVSAEPACKAGSGSGFIISSDGYVATNGHVVVAEAEDIFVELLVSDSTFLVAFLAAAGLNESQIVAIANNPEALSDVIALVYDAPADTYSLIDEDRRLWVSLGDAPVELDKDSFFADSQQDGVVAAELIGFDYAAKDVYTTQLSSETGFTASDVALLKVDVQDAPLIGLSDSDPVQNEAITIIGFPGDAENALVDTATLSVTTTNGVVSSIRQATGSESKLFQSDADASAGNSGGPAINKNGQAIGLLTYRFKSELASDASKSYIRDIADLNDLLRTKGISLQVSSSTQAAWLTGLDSFSKNRFNSALEDFMRIEQAYPHHRLVASYIEQTKKAIAEGKEAKDYPAAILIAGGVVGGMALSVGGALMVRHHQHHKRYLMSRQAA